MKILSNTQIHCILDGQYEDSNFNDLSSEDKFKKIRKHINAQLANAALSLAENPDQRTRYIELIELYASCLYSCNHDYVAEYYGETEG